MQVAAPRRVSERDQSLATLAAGPRRCDSARVAPALTNRVASRPGALHGVDAT